MIRGSVLMGRPRRPRPPTTPSGQELLRHFAEGKLAGHDAVADQSPLAGRGRLSPGSRRLVEIAALAAVGAPRVLWVEYLANEEGLGIDLEDVAEVLLTIAPIVGAPRIIAAADRTLAAADLLEDDEA